MLLCYQDFKGPNPMYEQLISMFSVYPKLDPICDRSYNGSTVNDLYHDVIPRRVYYDNRVISRKHRNIVYVLIQMKDEYAAIKSIFACEMNGFQSRVEVIKENTIWVKEYKPGFTHCNGLVKCIGFPQSCIRNGSFIKLIYKNKEDSCYSRVESEKPLILNNLEGKTTPTRGKGSIVVCTTLFGRPPYFNEWLKYQKAIGVDMVYLNVEASFAVNATSVYPYLGEALGSGFACMEVWKNYIGNKIHYYSESLKYVDCSMKFTGMFEYGFFYDVDEFFIPMIPSHKNIHYYLEKFFSDKKTASVGLGWRRFSCRLVKSIYNSLPNGNVTESLSGLDSNWDIPFKTMARLEGLEMAGVHDPERILPGYKMLSGDRTLAYIAHIHPNHACNSTIL